jgi:tripartite-type tricarboxylate transporter receptor subunit TctC
VRLIAPFAPGTVVDVFARVIGQWLSERLGQPFIVENRAGAAGNIGTEAVVRSPPDGYTLLMIGGSNAVSASLYDLKFNFIRDIVPIASTHRGPYCLVVHPSFPAKSVPELIAYAKANPGKVTVASGGMGTPQHLNGELFKRTVGIDMLHVPYKDGGLPDLLSGEVQVMINTLSTLIELIRAGKIRALAVTSAKRSEMLPDIPTVAESVPGYEAASWQGVGAPRNTPAEVIDKLNSEINTGLVSDARIKARIAESGGTVFATSPVELEKFIAEETDRWAKVIRAANIKAQ